MLFLKIIIFLAAFLMFQLELMIGKILLPNYGGSYMVWGACLVFFQAVLLLGYWFAHTFIKRVGLTRYRMIHLVLIFLPLFFFPGHALPLRYTLSALPLVVDVFRQLIWTIGLVFFVLSTMSLVCQVWLSQSSLSGKNNPYALFAISNIGSFAGLLTYPLIFEFYFDLETQQIIWRILYFALISVQLLAYRTIPVTESLPTLESDRARLRGREPWAVFLFAATGVMMFMAVTNLLTQEVLPIPLLWVMPLGVYLLSFFLVFKRNPWCPRWIENKIGLAVGYSIVLFFLMWRQIFPFLIELFCSLCLLFHICMFCQARLHRLKPENVRLLTSYYMLIALGGFIGGIVTNWIIPLSSTSLIEYFIALLILSLGILVSEKEKRFNFYSIRLILYAVACLIWWPIAFPKYNFLGLFILLVFSGSIFLQLRKNIIALTVVILLLVSQMSQFDMTWRQTPTVYRHRNYYGVYRIIDRQGLRRLLNGTILHGAQLLQNDARRIPLIYYTPNTPIAKIMTGDLNLKDIGIIGLGAGALAAYTQKGQRIDYFELDPDVVQIAQTYFSFLKDAPSQIRIIVGDARISLNKIPQKSYDLLVVDAFGGDAIPVHLLTREGIEKYHQVLKDNGMIIFHISNRYVTLDKVIARSAMELGAKAGYAYSKGRNYLSYDTMWLAITWDENNYKKFPQFNLRPVLPPEVRDVRGWTDAYSNLLPYLKLQETIWSVKKFRLFRCH